MILFSEDFTKDNSERLCISSPTLDCSSFISVMDNPSGVEENIEALATMLVALKYYSSRVARKEPKWKELWQVRIESNMYDFNEIQKELNETKDQPSTLLRLNSRVRESLMAVITLKEEVKSIMESIETSLPDVKGDNPKLEVVTPLKGVTETSLTGGKGEEPKLTVASPLKGVTETSLTGGEEDKPELGVITSWKGVTETPLIDTIGNKLVRFTWEDLAKFTSDFRTHEFPSGSGIGDVYKGQFPSGKQIVVKVLIGNDMIEDVFIAEVNTIFGAFHRNLVKLYGFCFEKHLKALIYEYVPNGSLEKVLHQEYHVHIEWEKLHEIATETAMGLLYLHEGCNRQLIHGDLKASNVLLDSNFSPKIKNFGVRKLIRSRDDINSTFTTIRGTTAYAAPEMCMPLLPITDKCDVYSFGMMLFEILGKKKNVQNIVSESKKIWDMYQNGQLDELVDEWAVGDKNRGKAKVTCMVALWCIQFTPEIRPSVSSVVKMLNMKIPVTTPPNPFMPSGFHQFTSIIQQAKKTKEDHRVERTLSDTNPASGRMPVKLPKKMRKSASTKSPFSHFEEEEVAKVLRQATVREGKSDFQSFGEDEEVDAKADDFINKFKQQLKLQRLDSILRYKEMLGRGAEK